LPKSESSASQGAKGKRENKAIDKTTSKGKAAQKDEELEKKMDIEAHDLCGKMKKAHNQDVMSNEKKKPALQKLLMIETVTKALRKTSLQEKFIDIGGPKWLGAWLKQLPDGSYPN